MQIYTYFVFVNCAQHSFTNQVYTQDWDDYLELLVYDNIICILFNVMFFLIRNL